MTTAPFTVLIEAAFRALLVALVVWAGLRLLRVSNVLAQKTVWALVLAAAVAMPLLMRWQGRPAFALVRVPLPVLRPAVQTAADAESGALSSPTGDLSSRSLPKPSAAHPSAAAMGGRYPAPAISIGGSGTSATAPLLQAQPEPDSLHASIAPRPVVRVIPWQSIAGFLYLAVAAAFILRVIFGLAAACRLWFGAQPVSLDLEQDRFPAIRLRCSSAISSPVTVGSAVLLPADYVDWDAEKLGIVLAHERSHIRQGDFYLQLLAALYAGLFWLSPLGWWLKSKLRNLGEAIGDHAALNQAASPASYAQLLLEFAALPRPTLIGVDMARPSTIAQRIERLLNDSTFRQAFAGSKRRALLAVLLVPVAIFAATALVRVEAGSVAKSQAPASTPPAAPASPDAATAPAAPTKPAEASSDAVPQAPESASSAEPATGAATGADAVHPPLPPEAPAVPGQAGRPKLPAPPDPPDQIDLTNSITIGNRIRTQVQEQIAAMKMHLDAGTYQIKGPDGDHSSLSFVTSDDGESYAIVSGPDAKVSFSGDWNGARSEDIEKARRMAHGKFLWFARDGKSYIVEDPAVIAQIEAMRKPMEDLGREQGELGRKLMGIDKLQGELGKQFELAKITAPDISKEMAELTSAMSKLQAQMGKEISREELVELQGKLAQLQGKLGAMYGRFSASGSDFGDKMGKLGAEQGELGEAQGKLGAEQGRLAGESDRKIRAIIEQSLHDGKAKPVQ
jgi:hypothetical protein